MFDELLLRDRVQTECLRFLLYTLYTCSSAGFLCKSFLFLSTRRFLCAEFGWYFLGGFSALLFVWLKREKMDSKRKVDSSSSFIAELFGIKESPTSLSTGIFASIFPPDPPPSAVIGRNSSSSKAFEHWQKQPIENQTWNVNHGMQEGATYNSPNKERNSIYQEERVAPCHLSSSLYYGGQDIFSHSASTQTSASYPTFNKPGGEDDPNGNNSQSASRGNWWQGSLYY